MPTDTAAIQAALTAVLPLVPGAVQVTLTRTDPDTGDSITVEEGVWAKRTKKRRGQFPAGGGDLPQAEVQWRLESTTAPFTCRVSDRITDPDGVTWVVTAVDDAGLSTRFVCQCVREN